MTRRWRVKGGLLLVLVVLALTASTCDGNPITVINVESVSSASRDAEPHVLRDNARFDVPSGVPLNLRITIESIGNYGGSACTIWLPGLTELGFSLTETKAPVRPSGGEWVPGLFTGNVAVPALEAGRTATANVECKEVSQSRSEHDDSFDLVTSIEAQPAGAGAAVTTDQFSLGLAPEVTGSPGVPAGYLRLWDMATAWKDVNPAPGVFNWTVLDQRVAQVEAAGAKVLYVAGLTPAWAASGGGCDPRWGDASCTAPADPATYSAYIDALMQRYGGRIAAVEIWNEANLTTFWKGTPDQMADLTQRANAAIKAASPGTIVLAASTTTRLAGSVKNVFGPYAAALKAIGYPFDAWSIHSYPAANTSPVGRFAGITAWKAQLATSTGNDATATAKSIWDTEINYGLAGPGDIPDRDLDADTAGRYVARTFVDSIRAGISGTFWYLWTAGPYGLVGAQMHTGTSSTIDAYKTVRSWTIGTTFTGCKEKTQVLQCYFTKPGGDPFFIAMAAPDEVVAYSSPAALPAETWEGTSVAAGAMTNVNLGPVKFTCVAGTDKTLCKGP